MYLNCSSNSYSISLHLRNNFRQLSNICSMPITALPTPSICENLKPGYCCSKLVISLFSSSLLATLFVTFVSVAHTFL